MKIKKIRIKSLRRAIIKEELIALAGDYQKAIILNWAIICTENSNGFDEYLSEINKRIIAQGRDQGASPGIEPSDQAAKAHQEPEFASHGWFYKSGQKWAQQTMLGLSNNGMKAHLKPLIEKGWLEWRTNPKFKWDRTRQYRANIGLIAQDLKDIGYGLDGYAFADTANGSADTATPSAVSGGCIYNKGITEGMDKEERRGFAPSLVFVICLKIWEKYTGQKRTPRKDLQEAFNKCCSEASETSQGIDGNSVNLFPFTHPARIINGWKKVVRFALLGYAQSEWHHEKKDTEGESLWILEKLFSNKKDEVAKYYDQFMSKRKKKPAYSDRFGLSTVCRSCEYDFFYQAPKESFMQQLSMASCSNCSERGSLRLKRPEDQKKLEQKNKHGEKKV